MAIAPESTENGRWLSVGGLRERGCAHLSRLEGSWLGRVTTHPRLLINMILLIMPSGRPLHDRLAGTVVVRTSS